jgi:hypothetical protein
MMTPQGISLRAEAVNDCVQAPEDPRKEAEYFDPKVADRIVNAVAEDYRLLFRIMAILRTCYGEAVALRRRLRVEESRDGSVRVEFARTSGSCTGEYLGPVLGSPSKGRQRESAVAQTSDREGSA